jgi:adenylate cyclase
MIEIERRFLVAADRGLLLDADDCRCLRQGYIGIEDDRQIRIRTMAFPDGSVTEAWLTMKSRGPGIVRSEIETPIDAGAAEEFLTRIKGRLIVKDRYEVLDHGLVWEIDVYRGDLAGLVVAEVELTRADQKVDIPAWAPVEITGIGGFGNLELAFADPEKARARARELLAMQGAVPLQP